MSVLVNGRSVKEYSQNGRIFIEAHKGSKYTLKLHNNSWQRVMAVFSVDGLDVIGGKPAGDSKTGYIMNAYETLEVKGYRINNNEVAGFVFTDKKQSYAAEKGDKSNAGVIGVRIFAEKQKPVQVMTTWIDSGTPKYTWGGTCETSILRCCSLDGNQGLAAQPIVKEPNFDLGTGWGNKVEDKVTMVSFEIGDLIAEMEVFYASRQNLEKMGIEFQPKKAVAGFPKAFAGFCEPPKSWRG